MIQISIIYSTLKKSEVKHISPSTFGKGGAKNVYQKKRWSQKCISKEKVEPKMYIKRKGGAKNVYQNLILPCY
jgi:hypothetical protein